MEVGILSSGGWRGRGRGNGLLGLSTSSPQAVVDNYERRTNQLILRKEESHCYIESLMFTLLHIILMGDVARWKGISKCRLFFSYMRIWHFKFRNKMVGFFLYLLYLNIIFCFLYFIKFLGEDEFRIVVIQWNLTYCLNKWGNQKNNLITGDNW